MSILGLAVHALAPGPEGLAAGWDMFRLRVLRLGLVCATQFEAGNVNGDVG